MQGTETDFVRWLTARQYAPATIRFYGVYVASAARHCDLDTATTPMLADWIETLPQTASSHIAARKALLAYYRSTGRAPSPADGLPRLPEPHRLPRPLTVADRGLWITAAKDLGGFHEIAGMMLATTGARIGELRNTRWVDLSLSTPGWWRIRGKGARRRGPAWRQQPLHPEVVRLLEGWPERRTWLFPGADGPLDDGPMRSLIVEIGEHAGLGRVLPHVQRHTTATLALSRTGDLRVVQELLGHRSIASTQVYTQVLPDRLAAVVAMLL